LPDTAGAPFPHSNSIRNQAAVGTASQQIVHSKQIDFAVCMSIEGNYESFLPF
jgi:hypothetical protein